MAVGLSPPADATDALIVVALIATTPTHPEPDPREPRGALNMKIVVLEDELAIGEVLEMRLRAQGHEPRIATDCAVALDLLRRETPDVILSDVCLPDGNGIELIEKLRRAGKDCPIVLMTAFGTIDVAVEAMKRGASDFLTKPLDYKRLYATLERLEKQIEFTKESRAQKAAPRAGDPAAPTNSIDAMAAEAQADAPSEAEHSLGALVGKSQVMRSLYAELKKLAPTDTSIFICGESGTGKEVVARTIHAMSKRQKAPLIALNMAALPEGVVEAELFGHARGSFTGAVAARPGAFEMAHGGTLFLDELAEMPIALQPKLLRVLEGGTFRPIGARAEMCVDVRILAATNRDPLQAIADGRLREDLFYRLNVFMLTLPPLRERREDIPLLTRAFVRQFNKKHGTTVAGIGADALDALARYAWPGNVRELRNFVERAVILARSGELTRAHFPESILREARDSAPNGGDGSEMKTPAPLVLPPDVTAAEAERILIMETLRQMGQNKAAAARKLGMDVKTIRNKLKQYGLSTGGEGAD
ncbi:MAG: sigma-54 dependent transcriptional regulator [Myxococcales bacterium]|jgi:DNA-binding NtrC family response regulator|nr:sigma-54 dependent transcriptional regulator [Myxococcales bacterium]